MVIAHGVDLVDIASTEALLSEPSDQFLVRCFTERERRSVGTGVERIARLCGRFAVKEAVLKALGTGVSNGIGFHDVEVVPLATGAPMVTLHGRAQERARALGITRWLVSISHEGGMAMASVIALGDQTGAR